MESKEYKFKFSENEANIIVNALATQPFNQVNQLINNIQKQAQEQATEPEKACIKEAKNKEVR